MSDNYQNMLNQQYYQQFQQQQYPPQPPKKPSLTWLWITLAVLACLVALIWWISTLPRRVDNAVLGESQATETVGPYLAALYVEGTMTVSASADNYLSATGDGNYDQQYYLDTIDSLMADDQNVGLMLYVNSPGGEVLAADELARKVKEYQDTTGRPVYAYGYNYAASGGYWLISAADWITENTYCITGSIGVTMGNLIDLTGLLEKYGVKSYNLASGGEKKRHQRFNAHQRGNFERLSKHRG